MKYTQYDRGYTACVRYVSKLIRENVNNHKLRKALKEFVNSELAHDDKMKKQELEARK